MTRYTYNILKDKAFLNDSVKAKTEKDAAKIISERHNVTEPAIKLVAYHRLDW